MLILLMPVNSILLHMKGRVESGCGAGLWAITSEVLNSSMVSATTSNSESEAFSWLASIRMASEEVTCVKEWEGTVKD